MTRGCSLTEEIRQRLQSARERLEAARLLLGEGYLPDAINRAYYGGYEAARALLLAEDVQTRTHAGLINQLGRHFREALNTRTLTKLRQDREGCDYELVRLSVSRVRLRLNQAQDFIDQAAELLRENCD